ncbi:hypothetical protein LCGC14_2253500 [marine sediment metagenome]|uniref:Uncharacterized protein n=1 Tax=marine sediment metagenome TaxID=412755 RepID=A0A0F9D1M8_9ZZZZ
MEQLTPEEILDDYARDLKHINNRHDLYMIARSKAIAQLAKSQDVCPKWVKLIDLREGAIFETQKGTLAVKSEYLYSNKPDSQCQCILIASGEYAHFEHKNDELVREITCQGTGKLTKAQPDREKIAEAIMNGLGKMLGMPSVPKWNSLADYLKEPYRVFADQIIALFPVSSPEITDDDMGIW